MASLSGFCVHKKIWTVSTSIPFQKFHLATDQSNRVLGKVLSSSGTTSGTIIDLKFIIVAAAKANAQGLILSHNHPSGNTNPSRADRDLTDKIKAACQIISVTLLDHVIVTPHDGYSSFADEGWI